MRVTDKLEMEGQPVGEVLNHPGAANQIGITIQDILLYIFISLFRACAESQSAEHGSRLAAMQAAEKNLDENREDLIGQYQRVRQEMITTELLDVVAGFEAVSNESESFIS